MENNGNDTLSDYIVYVVVFMLLIGLYSFVIQPKLNSMWVVAVLYEAKLIAYYATGDLLERARDVISWASINSGEDVTPGVQTMIENKLLIAAWHRWFILGLLALTAIPIYKKRSAYSGLPNIESLLKTEHKIWPILEFVKRFNPIKEFNELSGIGRYVMSPAVFASETKIIPNMASTAKGSKYDRIFDEAQAVKVFSEQLGGRFISYSKLPSFHKVMITLAVAKDLPFHFKSYDTLHRMFSIELAQVNESYESMSKFIDELCMPLMQVLDGKIYYGSANIVSSDNILVTKYLAKSKDFTAGEQTSFLLKYGIRSSGSKFKLLSNHECMLSSNFDKTSSLSNIKYPIIKDLILSISKQHIEDKSNKTILRETTFELFRGFLSKRAYVSTLIIDACRMTKRNGKFPPCRFIFFRPWDRLLFNVISASPKYDEKEDRAIVTKSNICEINGAMAHYYIEEMAGRKMLEPQVETAVIGLKTMLIRQNVIVDDV